MANITNKITNKFYEYDPNQFMPIYRDHKLANMDEFVKYKLTRIAKRLYRALLPAVNKLDEFIVSK